MNDDLNCPDQPISPPVPPAAPYGVHAFWERPLHELGKVDIAAFSPEWAERHRIYSLLTMALIHGYWNGNKSGADGVYPWRRKQRLPDKDPPADEESPPPGRYAGDTRFGDRYLGHNIACLAVDENGEIIDFDFNHNDLYNSSAEHAESRLVRRIFSLNQVFDHWQTESEKDRERVKYDSVFSGTTIYTSLESCAQCSGVMTLANVKRVVYLQSDPGQYFVGNILYNLSQAEAPKAMLRMHDAIEDNYARPPVVKPKYRAPEPIDASLFGFKYKGELESGYLNFVEVCGELKKVPFFQGPGPNDEKKYTKGLTSFLCTDDAKDIFEAATKEFSGMSLQYGTFAPVLSDGKAKGFSNDKVLTHSKKFLEHALNQGNRGTPHR
jgi:tRNA(Arg) A34 adenosine deaminase TadA